jgi:hypothetical protein
MSKVGLVFAVVLLMGFGCAGRDRSQSTAPPPEQEAPPAEELKQVHLGEDTGCKRAGCSRELCVDGDAGFIASPCLRRAHYHCYDDAECARQEDGRCAWTQTDALRECIENAPGSK